MQPVDVRFSLVAGGSHNLPSSSLANNNLTMCNCSVYGKSADHIVYDGFPCTVPHQEKMQNPLRATEVCSFPSPQIVFPSSWNVSDVAFPAIPLTSQELQEHGAGAGVMVLSKIYL